MLVARRYEAMLNEGVTASLSRATAAEARATAAEASTAAALTAAEDLSRQSVVGAPLELGPRRPESETRPDSEMTFADASTAAPLPHTTVVDPCSHARKPWKIASDR